MSAERRSPDATTATAGSADLPPAASLLSVPIFRAAAQQHAALRQAPAARPISDAAASTALPAATPGPDGASPAVQPVAEGMSAANNAPYAVVGGTDGGSRAPTEAAGARPTPALKAVDGAHSYRSLLDYWRTLARQGRAAVEKLDGDLIAARWPYAMLIRVPRGGVVDITKVFAPEPAASANGAAAPTAQHPFARDQASQISSWVLDIAQEAAGSRQPSRHTETFQQAGRSRRITAELLPCHADGDSADHLLLQLRDG